MASSQVQIIRSLAEAGVPPHRVMQYENGSIAVATGGAVRSVAKPPPRPIAAGIGADPPNGNGGAKSTRRPGADVIRMADARVVG